MLTIDLFSEVRSSITVNKVRSSLTILGIVIGIGSVIAMTGIGRGAQKSIETSIASIGANLLMVRPGAGFGPDARVSGGQGSAQTMVREDAEAIAREARNIVAVAPENSGRYQIVSKGKNTNTSVSGVTADYAAVRNIQVAKGNFINSQQDKSRAKVVVIGPEVKTDIFGVESDPIGQKIRIKGLELTVIGVTASKGGTGFGSSDDLVYVPLSTAQQFLSGNDSLSLISVEVKDQLSMTAAQDEITKILLKQHKIADKTEADFRIMNQADIIQTASSVTGTFTILLGAVAGISLLVGGIGIMNMMLTTVTERTREIGLRKAIGANRGDINRQFLLEAIALTFLGGVFGILLGYSLAWGVQKYGNITTDITWSSVALAVGVSTLIGIIFGFYPARRAARLNPIEALRYE